MKTILTLLSLIFMSAYTHAQDSLDYKVGMSKIDITKLQHGGGTLGYSISSSYSTGIETSLYARTYVIEDASGNKAAIVNLELCFVPSELKARALEVLNDPEFNEENVLVMAQHTHSGPGGYCHHAAYNFSVTGYIKEIFEFMAEKIALSIAEAKKVMVPCKLQLNNGTFPLDWEVGFNRSIQSYNQNPDVEKQSFENRHKAINRDMNLLQFVGAEHLPLGSINWFGVHTTSISNDIHDINADNKGYAALLLEKEYLEKNPNYIAAFAQGTAGDVTPKFIYNKKHHWQRGAYEGKFPDDIESAKYNGGLQYRKAKEIIADPNQYQIKASGIHCAMRYFDFSNIQVDKQYFESTDDKFTSPSCIGMAMLAGAEMDGPGAPKIAVKMGSKWAKKIRKKELKQIGDSTSAEALRIRRKYDTQGPKDIILETGLKRVLGYSDLSKLPIPAFADPMIAAIKRQYKAGALKENSWSPQVLPLQLVQIGDLVLAALPFEITTTAGNRLRAGIEKLYKEEGVAIKQVILCPYANSYSGYITTYEEYQMQRYEGGHTVFGQYSLAALQTVFKRLFKDRFMHFNKEEHLTPPTFSAEELSKRSFVPIKH